MNAAEWPLYISIGIFAVAAVAVWAAGSRLARYASAISDRTGIGQEFLGMILLGGVTSLPELAVATTATLQGSPLLSINDVLGSAAINIVILAIADAVIGRNALTSMLPSPRVMLQGVVGILMMAVVAAAVLAGNRLVFGAGIWSWIMVAVYLASIRLLSRSHATQAWTPSDRRQKKNEGENEKAGGREGYEKIAMNEQQPAEQSTSRLRWKTAAAAAVILAAGFLLARTGEAIAEQTGLGASFFGAAVLGLSTSLPEVSTVVAAVRLRRYTMAISDVFGTNLFNVTIIMLVDLLHSGEPVLSLAGPFAGFAALLALALTAVYLAGILERRDRTFLRMGLDSAVVVLAYSAGVVVLYGLR